MNSVFVISDHPDGNACLPNPCENGGACESSGNGFTCTCEPGWMGETCDTPDYCFSDPCKNGGSCENGDDGFTCTCEPGWMGDTCESEITVFQNDPCKNGGSCENGVDGFICTCAPGWLGDTCESKIFQYFLSSVTIVDDSYSFILTVV
ncbi:hypothetical protein CAPTEDRAFT_120633 [Capitella teleta]|uniref:EGF-like domain-containing protein n=1 Tax=Capitella teleta TaxID=283909 RepID=R7T805_CAPTE|nr:hypothetical protein CAPTEDRAFT_120633 [Capitella teleta]|eukprot:ELT87560.1 hypothetical protein CAPTEDRAFT_120633 [Capitella teleta]